VRTARAPRVVRSTRACCGVRRLSRDRRPAARCRCCADVALQGDRSAGCGRDSF